MNERKTPKIYDPGQQLTKKVYQRIIKKKEDKLIQIDRHTHKYILYSRNNLTNNKTETESRKKVITEVPEKRRKNLGRCAKDKNSYDSTKTKYTHTHI